MDKIILSAIVAAVAATAAAYTSGKLSFSTLASNRAVEFPENEKSDPLSKQQIDWTVVHVRDDLGCIANYLVMTNALLAGILAVLIVR